MELRFKYNPSLFEYSVLFGSNFTRSTAHETYLNVIQGCADIYIGIGNIGTFFQYRHIGYQETF